MTCSKSDVLIIGGGIIGVACAYECSRRGMKVTLVDKGEIGHGCSYGNAGWLTPCFALPLPMPGMLRTAVRWLLDRDSPLYIQPRMSLALARWLWRFQRSMNQAQMLSSVRALVELSKISLDEYRRLNTIHPDAFGFGQRGLLMVAQSSAGLLAAEQERRLVAAHGVAGQRLTAQEIAGAEPALNGADGNLSGAVLFPDEADVEPLATVRHLAEQAQLHGARLLSDIEMLDFVTSGNRVDGILTTRGHLSAASYVLATGAWSARVAGKLGVRVPVLSGKGYAMIVPPEHVAVMPRRPIMLIDRKIAITPRQDGTLRIAGTLELVDLDERVTLRRVRAIWRGAHSVLQGLPEDLQICEIWRGLRPCTPDGVPVIGPTDQWDNLYLAAGHQMLGLQTAPGTACLVADLIAGARCPCVDPEPFRASRF